MFVSIKFAEQFDQNKKKPNFCTVRSEVRGQSALAVDGDDDLLFTRFTPSKRCEFPELPSVPVTSSDLVAKHVELMICAWTTVDCKTGTSVLK